LPRDLQYEEFRKHVELIEDGGYIFGSITYNKNILYIKEIGLELESEGDSAFAYISRSRKYSYIDFINSVTNTGIFLIKVPRGSYKIVNTFFSIGNEYSTSKYENYTSINVGENTLHYFGNLDFNFLDYDKEKHIGVSNIFLDSVKFKDRDMKIIENKYKWVMRKVEN